MTPGSLFKLDCRESKVADLWSRGSAWTIRLHEKGGKQHAMPCRHALAKTRCTLTSRRPASPKIARASVSPLTRAPSHRVSRGAVGQPDEWRMIQRRLAFMRRSATTVSARQVSPPNWRTRERWSTLRKWQRTRVHALRSFMIERRGGYRRTRWGGSGCESAKTR